MMSSPVTSSDSCSYSVRVTTQVGEPLAWLPAPRNECLQPVAEGVSSFNYALVLESGNSPSTSFLVLTVYYGPFYK